MPTPTYGTPSTVKRCIPDDPPVTFCRSSSGRTLSGRSRSVPVGGDVRAANPADSDGSESCEEVGDPVGIGAQHLAHRVGAGERLRARRCRAFVDQVGAGEQVGRHRQPDAGDQRDQTEEQRDACPEAEGADRHGDKCGIQAEWNGNGPKNAAAGETPGGGRCLTGAA